MSISLKACNRHSHRYLIRRVKKDGGAKGAKKFNVLLFYREGQNETEHHVARIKNDTGTTIFDKLFKPNQPSVPINLDYWQSVRKIDDNWELYADEYEKHHRP